MLARALIQRRFAALFAVLIFSAAALTVLVPARSFAGAYGVGGYSSCRYQEKCPAPPPPTTTTLPSGLQVAVNLSEGQGVPRDGYTIVVTPLNDTQTGASIKTVDIYIDSVLVQTATPDETGTVRWRWVPADTPGTDVKLVVTGNDDSVVTEEFHVVVNASEQPAGSGGVVRTEGNGSGSGGVGAALVDSVQHAYNSVKKFVGTLPKPVAYGFPYVLFVLLGLNVLVLLVQAARELREYHLWQKFISRERTAAEVRQTLFQLIAHYFRTPITVLMGGIDLLESESAAAAANLQAVSKRLHDGVERLIAQTKQTAEPVAIGRDTAAASAGSFVRQAGLFVPIILVAAIVLPFDYLVHAAGKLSVSQVNLAVQAITFALLIVLTYVVYRQLQLHRQDAREQQHIYAQEQAMHRASDELVDGVVSTLRSDVAELGRLAARLPDSASSTYIIDGNTRLQNLLTRIAVAQRLEGALHPGPLVPLQLHAVLQQVMQTLQAKADEHHIVVQAGEDAQFLVRSPELCSFVLQSVLDNAIAYSKDNAEIHVAATTPGAETMLTVIDSGSGVPTEKLPFLFQPFSKAEGAEVFTHEGMGFSLYLDKLIMTYLGGTIDLASEPGQGTTVTLHFPQVAAAAPTTLPESVVSDVILPPA